MASHRLTKSPNGLNSHPLVKPLGVCAFVAILCFSTSASAVTVSGPGILSDVSGPGILSFDLDLSDASPVALKVTLHEGDTDPIEFTAVIFNFIDGSPELTGFELVLSSGATFEVVGDATDGFETFYSTTATGPSAASIDFTADPSATVVGFEIGDPLGMPDPETGATSWEIGIAEVAGSSFGLELRPLPEPPPTAVLPLVAIFAALQDAARRKHR